MSASLMAMLLGLAPPGAAPAAQPSSAELAPPVRVEAAGKPIDTDIGHAAPFVADFDGDGKRDLLVGQFGDGILWIYRNEGSNAKPKLAAGTKFKEGTPEGRVPTG
jgi:FG-GAP repeat protein